MAYQWININKCVPPHRITDYKKAIELYFSMKKEGGWKKGAEVLVGYWIPWHILKNRYPRVNCAINLHHSIDQQMVQLVSGGHRLAAAQRAGLSQIPVQVLTYKEANDIWGSDKWVDLLSHPGVKW